MDFKERVYGVLAVSASDAFSTALREVLPPSSFSSVRVVPDAASARRALSERAFDFVIINSPLGDESFVRFAIDASCSDETVVLFLARTELYNEVYLKLTEEGVFLLQKPVSKTVFSFAVKWLMSARERLRKSETKTLSMAEKMEEIRLVNRAKWLLIEKRGMSEPEAHRYLEKQAMDRCVTRRRIAEEILDAYK